MEDSKILMALGEELRAIRKDLAEMKATQMKLKDQSAQPPNDYVAVTEQRFVNINLKLDRLVSACKEQKFVITLFTIGGVALGIAVILKEVVTRILHYAGAH